MGDGVQSICPIGISQFSEPSTTRHERLIGLRATVAIDGESTSFAVQYTNMHAFRVHIPFQQIPKIFAEVRHATNLMFTRQRLTLDRGSSKFSDLIELAITPRDVEVYIDPKTNDRLFVFQFLDHTPVSLRMSAIQVECMLGRLAHITAASYN
jgi:hypothetical protein